MNKREGVRAVGQTRARAGGVGAMFEKRSQSGHNANAHGAEQADSPPGREMAVFVRRAGRGYRAREHGRRGQPTGNRTSHQGKPSLG